MFANLTSFEGSLFDDLRRLQQEMAATFSPYGVTAGIRSVAHGTFPPINVGATPEAVEVYLFAPGLDPRSLDIAIQQNLLTVAGERKLAARPEENQVYRQERFDGAFKRVIALPEDVDPDQVSARYRDGVLHVSIKRREASRPRQITVN